VEPHAPAPELKESGSPTTDVEVVEDVMGNGASSHESHKPGSQEVESGASHDDHDLSTLSRQKTPEDPFAAIQARILARRSIGGTTSFHPRQSSPPLSSTSTSSTATIASRSSTVQQQQNLASALVKKACAVFLGPPAHLVAIMLKIAARFADGAMGFGSYLVYQSPAGSKRVPGSFNLESIDADDFDDDRNAQEQLEGWEDDEDDFGVPLRSPIRLAALQRTKTSDHAVRERRGWDRE
jgi:hypothetical protein